MDIEALEKMIENGRDSAMLRLTLAGQLQKNGADSQALTHLQKAVEMDPRYTAAWKALGQLQLDMGEREAARHAWQQGITVAEQKGDKQAQKEMQVFLKRLDQPPRPSQQ